MLHASPVLLGSQGRVAGRASLGSCWGPSAGQGTPSTWEQAAPRLHPQTGQQELPRTTALRIQPVPRGCFWPEQHPQACELWGQEQLWHPRPCSDPPEPQLRPPRNQKLALPTLAWQTGAKQAPYRHFPCGIGALAAGDTYLAAQRGSLQGRLPWLGAGDHPPGDEGVRAASLSAVGKAPCWEEALRLRPAAPLPGCLLPLPASVPLPAPSGEICRLSKRREMKATVPVAQQPRQEERESPSQPFCSRLASPGQAGHPTGACQPGAAASPWSCSLQGLRVMTSSCPAAPWGGSWGPISA